MPTLITQADRYYIDKDRLYITRYEEISDTERLYFAPREKPDDLTDTFLAVGTNISMGGGVIFTPQSSPTSSTISAFRLIIR